MLGCIKDSLAKFFRIGKLYESFAGHSGCVLLNRWLVVGTDIDVKKMIVGFTEWSIFSRSESLCSKSI